MVAVGDSHVQDGRTSPHTMDAVGTVKTGTITDSLVWKTEGGEVGVSVWVFNVAMYVGVEQLSL